MQSVVRHLLKHLLIQILPGWRHDLLASSASSLCLLVLILRPLALSSVPLTGCHSLVLFQMALPRLQTCRAVVLSRVKLALHVALLGLRRPAVGPAPGGLILFLQALVPG